MTTSVAIVVALVVLAAVLFAVLGRSKGGAQLQGPPAARPLPPPNRPESRRPEAKKAEPVARPPSAAPSPILEAEARPGVSARPPPPVPEPPKASTAPPTASVPPSRRDVAGLRKGLAATRGGFVAKLSALFQGKKAIDPAILEQMEEVMLASDVGPKTTQAILARLRDSLDRNELRDSDAVWAALRAEASRILGIGGGAVKLSAKPTVVLMVGVNGVGKTTTIGKLSTRFNMAGKKVVLAAGDTFRAAAVQQLEVWGKRVGAEVVRGKEGADPGAVAFDATNRAKETGADLLLIDTAGRLHTKAPLI